MQNTEEQVRVGYSKITKLVRCIRPETVGQLAAEGRAPPHISVLLLYWVSHLNVFICRSLRVVAEAGLMKKRNHQQTPGARDDKTQDRMNGQMSESTGEQATDCVSSAGVRTHQTVTFIAAALLLIRRVTYH